MRTLVANSTIVMGSSPADEVVKKAGPSPCGETGMGRVACLPDRIAWGLMSFPWDEIAWERIGAMEA